MQLPTCLMHVKFAKLEDQAVPLSRSEKCIVGTRLERQAVSHLGASAIAQHELLLITRTRTDK
ncbi:hypothetical protein AMTRI_Chr09g17010 [Amborella trichopoda]